MTRTVDFYYELGSRYSYLASARIAGIERTTGATFNWLPLSSRRLIGRGGRDPFAGEPLSGQYDWAYRQRDAEDLAAWLGIPFREPVGRLTFDQDLAAMAAMASGRQGAVVAMSHRFFRLIYVDDRTTLERGDFIAEAEAEGLDTARFVADLDDAGLRREHDVRVEKAASRGVFGIPAFLVGERMFWGQDRLDLVEAALTGRI